MRFVYGAKISPMEIVVILVFPDSSGELRLPVIRVDRVSVMAMGICAIRLREKSATAATIPKVTTPVRRRGKTWHTVAGLCSVRNVRIPTPDTRPMVISVTNTSRWIRECVSTPKQ